MASVDQTKGLSDISKDGGNLSSTQQKSSSVSPEDHQPHEKDVENLNCPEQRNEENDSTQKSELTLADSQDCDDSRKRLVC
ncbi:unnamed protein product [Linum trigynum]|uniref:Uncharacterized protein n=1 Tax=Linum trigynum TaxID=586398 RepID=A0AAV2FWE1_9ROSI